MLLVDAPGNAGSLLITLMPARFCRGAAVVEAAVGPGITATLPGHNSGKLWFGQPVVLLAQRFQLGGLVEPAPSSNAATLWTTLRAPVRRRPNWAENGQLYQPPRPFPSFRQARRL